MFGLKRFKIRSRFTDIIKPGVEIVFKDMETVILHNQFMQSPIEFMILAEIRWRKRTKDPLIKLNELNEMVGWFEEITVVSHEEKNTLAFFQGQYEAHYSELFNTTMKEFACFLEFPIYVTEEFGESNLVGPPEEVKALIEFVQQWGSIVEVQAVKDFHTVDKGILAVLTDRQLEVLKGAYAMGYFDRPKKMDSREIAYKMGISHATFLAHVRKSEKRILDALLAGA